MLRLGSLLEYELSSFINWTDLFLAAEEADKLFAELPREDHVADDGAGAVDAREGKVHRLDDQVDHDEIRMLPQHVEHSSGAVTENCEAGAQKIQAE